jgi:hypothetical protein
MTTNRVLMVLMILNLFSTLLVFRGMQILVERVEATSCSKYTGAPADQRPMDELALPRNESRVDERSAAKATTSTPMAASSAAAAVSFDSPSSFSRADANGLASGMDDTDRIKSQFASQYSDSLWTAEVHAVFQTLAFSNPAYTGISQELVECKERVCKLALGYSDAALFDDFIGELTEGLKGDLSATLYFEEPSTLAGNSRVEIYLVRE